MTADLTVPGNSDRADNNGKTVIIDLQNHSISGGGSKQAFWNRGTLTIKNGTIQNCKTDRGAAINNRGTLTLENVTISNCTGNIEAGGIMNYSTLTMTGGKITDCNASRGGAIRIRPYSSGGSGIENTATATLTNVEISDNSCDGRRDSGDGQYGRGGAIAVTNGTLTMDGCTVSGNKSTDDDGGAIDFDASAPTIPNMDQKREHESQVTVISCKGSRSFLESIGIKGEIISTPSHSADSVSVMLDNGQCFVGDLEHEAVISGYENNEALKNDWDRVISFQPKQVFFAHANETDYSCEAKE